LLRLNRLAFPPAVTPSSDTAKKKASLAEFFSKGGVCGVAFHDGFRPPISLKRLKELEMPSSPWNYISPLWTVQRFKIETDNGWGRSQLRRIDGQLAAAKAAEGNPNLYVQALAKLVDECREWMISKERKFARKAKTRSYEKRLAAIATLMAQTLQHLKFFAFEGQKAKGAHGNLVGLKPGFDRERQEFDGMKQANPWNKGLPLDPHSASFVTAGMGDIARGRIDFRQNYWDPGVDPIVAVSKSVDQMSDDEFYLMSSQLKRFWGAELGYGGFLPRVHYIRKVERINNNMLIALGGFLYKDSGRIRYNSAGREGKDIYAMDKYGNLISIADNAQFDGKTYSAEHRHSSLNAGNNVICAGYIKVEQGAIKYIDNKSGHYKPSEKDLARCIATLMDEHSLNLDAANIVGYIPYGTNSIAKHTDVIGGKSFISQIIPPPPYPQAY
jgi:hypothetical protein